MAPYRQVPAALPRISLSLLLCARPLALPDFTAVLLETPPALSSLLSPRRFVDIFPEMLPPQTHTQAGTFASGHVARTTALATAGGFRNVSERRLYSRRVWKGEPEATTCYTILPRATTMYLRIWWGCGSLPAAQPLVTAKVCVRFGRCILGWGERNREKDVVHDF